MDELQSYLRDDPAGIGFGRLHKGGLATRARTLTLSARSAFRVARVQMSAPYWRRKASKIAAGGSALRLHLGCGTTILSGWVNIDIFVSKVNLPWDLRRGIPFPDASCEAVFHEHMLEHMTTDQGWCVLRECHRVLRTGGVLRIGVPDFAAYARSYMERGAGLISEARPGRPTPLIAFQEVFYGHEHRAMYDADTLFLLLRSAGFNSAENMGFGHSRLDPCPDSEDRRVETFYVEAVK